MVLTHPGTYLPGKPWVCRFGKLIGEDKMNETKEVYKAIVAIQAELAKSGISKERTNTQGPAYQFRGIDDVYKALAPLLAKNNLCIIPRVMGRDMTERTSKSGGALFDVNLAVEYDIVSSVDGSIHTAKMYGEAMDSGDKATNKAASAAYKYLCFQTFCIPTEGDNDADGSTHEVAANTEHRPTTPPQRQTREPRETVGLVEAKGQPNAGGYVTYTINGAKVSTKDKEIMETLDNRMKDKVKVCVRYIPAENPRWPGSIEELIVVEDKFPF